MEQNIENKYFNSIKHLIQDSFVGFEFEDDKISNLVDKIIKIFNNSICMNKKDIKQIIYDYDFACEIVKRYGDNEINNLYDIFNMLGYHCYNLYNDKDTKLFDMEVGNLTLTYNKECNGIENGIQVWNNEDWEDTTIDELRKNLKELENE